MKVVNKGILHVFSKLTPSGVTKYITSFYHLLTCVTQFVCTDRCSYETVNFKNNDSVLEDLNQEICLLIIFNEFSKGFFCTFYDSNKSWKHFWIDIWAYQTGACYELSIVDTMPGEKSIYMYLCSHWQRQVVLWNLTFLICYMKPCYLNNYF